MPYACECGRKLDLVAALDALPPNGTSRSGMVYAKCTACEKGIELRLRNNRFEVGYSYFGGSMHFESTQTVRVSGLKIVPSDLDDLDVTLGERHWHFSVSTPSHQRFIVFANAFAAGKRLAELDFGQWNVTVEAIERNAANMTLADDLVLATGDFLHLCGPGPALTRAWHYLNDGKSVKRQGGVRQ